MDNFIIGTDVKPDIVNVFLITTEVFYHGVSVATTKIMGSKNS